MAIERKRKRQLAKTASASTADLLEALRSRTLKRKARPSTEAPSENPAGEEQEENDEK